MKVSNWLYNRVRHTRSVNRVYKQGRITWTMQGLKLESELMHMDIELTDDEIWQLMKDLRALQQLRKDSK